MAARRVPFARMAGLIQRNGASVSRRGLSTEAKAVDAKATETAASATTKAPVEEVPEPTSLGKRIALFAGLVTAGGLGTFSYLITSNEEYLFQARDAAPQFVNFLAPYIGLPIDEETRELDVEALGPRDVSELVGEQLVVVAKLQSGRVVRVTVGALDNNAAVEQKCVEAAGTDDAVADVMFVDQEDVEKISAMSEDELVDTYGDLKIPEIQAAYGKRELRMLLEACRQMEFDLKVRYTLAQKYGYDLSALTRAMDKLEERKVEVKLAIKAAQF
jgi:hypothetical protein